MIEVQSIDLNPQTKTAKVFLMCDTKEEVTADAKIDGLPAGYTLAPFSKCMTKSRELAFLGSDGQWAW